MMDSTTFSDAVRAEHNGLQRLVHPYDVETFLGTYMGEQMLHGEGAPDRWAALFSWEDLNRVLNQDLLSYPHARLLKEGAPLDATLYTYEVASRRWLSAELCHRHLAEGATLIVDALERVTPTLESFIRELEHDLQAEAHVDLVATCGVVPGLNMHWDDSECFNIQLDGEKRWEVVRPERLHPLTPTRQFPLRKDIEQSPMPGGLPTWSGIVRPGDMIYLPRGWWHNVTPRASPSLHLSISVDVPTVSDFLVWFAQQAVRHATVRRVMPSWAKPEQRRAFLNEALTVIESQLSIETMEAYLDQCETAATNRSPFMLPESASLESQTLTTSAWIRLRSTKALRWNVEGDKLRFQWRGHQYEFNSAVLPALQRLDSMRTFTLAELSGGLSPLLVRAFVTTLLAVGMVVVTPTPHAPA